MILNLTLTYALITEKILFKVCNEKRGSLSSAFNAEDCPFLLTLK